MKNYKLQHPEKYISENDVITFDNDNHLKMGYYSDTNDKVVFWSYKNSGDLIDEMSYIVDDETYSYVPDFILLLENEGERVVEMIDFETKNIMKGECSTPEEEEQYLLFQERSKLGVSFCRENGWYYRVVPQ